MVCTASLYHLYLSLIHIYQTDDGNKADGQSADAKSGTGQTGEGSAVPVMAGVSQDPANANRASYTVKAGDTLADICKMYYGGLDKLEELCSINGIEDENKILPGQKLFLP